MKCDLCKKERNENEGIITVILPNRNFFCDDCIRKNPDKTMEELSQIVN